MSNYYPLNNASTDYRGSWDSPIYFQSYTCHSNIKAKSAEHFAGASRTQCPQTFSKVLWSYYIEKEKLVSHDMTKTVSRRRANHLFQDCKIKLGILLQLQSTFSLVLAFANSFISLLPGQNFCGNQTNRLETSFPHVSQYGLPICRKFGFFTPSSNECGWLHNIWHWR